MNVAFDTLDARFGRMRDYLAGLQGARRMACRSDLDPLRFPDLLPFVNLIDVVLENDAVRFRFRLVGTAQSEAAQLDYARRFVDDVVDPASRPRVLEDLTRVVATCMPHYGRYGMPFPGRGFIDSERVFYPLSADDRMVDCILALHHYPDVALPQIGAQGWHLGAWRQALDR
ncbi:PAS domain-containing protein [Dongia deserti]|uniref:PAS domain-containing protein n=1 Tax=Dongia deserti TaxID=2268030 RepID=UPI000E65A582|nr:PAS domain-containing protein [Dongia deserti]